MATARWVVAIVLGIRRIYCKRTLVLPLFFRMQNLNFVWGFTIFAQ